MDLVTTNEATTIGEEEDKDALLVGCWGGRYELERVLECNG